MKTPEEIRGALPQFTGTENHTKWSPLFPRHLLTDGVAYLAEAAECFWLMDLIGSYQHGGLRDQNFQVWKLTKPPGDLNVAVASCEDGNDRVLIHQKIPYTDFPLDEGVTLYAVRNEHRGVTITLPSEY